MSVTTRAARLDDASGIALVHVESWRTTYRGIVPDAYLDRMSIGPRERFWAGIIGNPEGGDVVHVAESDSEEIIGFASGGSEREGNPEYTSELFAIYLLQQHQRHGIGRRLTREIVRELLARGHASMLVWVLRNNPSRRFYERLDGVAIAEKPIDIGGVHLVEVAYGWRNLTHLGDAFAEDGPYRKRD